MQPDTQQTPSEVLVSAYQVIKTQLAHELLTQFKECTPKFFERLVVNLLVKMGYGGSQEDAGQVIGQTGDGGIDGLIKQDQLGLDVIYIQVKRWTKTPVGSRELRDFRGALDLKNAEKHLKELSGLVEDEFFRYFGTTPKGIAIEIGKVQRCEDPFGSYERIPGFVHPRSFCYIDSQLDGLKMCTLR